MTNENSIVIKCSRGMGNITIPPDTSEEILLALRRQGADIQGLCVGEVNIYMCKCKINEFLNGEIPKPTVERE